MQLEGGRWSYHRVVTDKWNWCLKFKLLRWFRSTILDEVELRVVKEAWSAVHRIRPLDRFGQRPRGAAEIWGIHRDRTLS